MRENWQRGEPEIPLGRDDAERLLRDAFPGACVVSLVPLPGGLINSNFAVTLNGPPHRVLLRLIQRETQEARREAALIRLMQGRVPTPHLLYFAASDPRIGHPWAVLEWAEGTRLDLAPADPGDAELGPLGRSIGTALAAIHAIRFAQHGFLDDALHVTQPLDFSRAGCVAFLRDCLLQPPAIDRLGAALAHRAVAFVQDKAALFDAWPAPPCLAHADFNATNILVHRDGNGIWQLSAVLDWEFALSGLPGFDFGNLLRGPLGRRRAFVEAVAEGYRAAGGFLPPEWQRIAALVDLLAWADMLRRHSSPGFVADARAIVRATIEAG